MSDYRLLVRKLTNPGLKRYEWLELDLGSERPAMTYQINTLAELKDRNASYSQNIKLPKSSRNLQALGFIDNIDVVADAVYDPLRCELSCDGIPISPAGALLYIDKIGKEIDGQIVSVSYDFFKALEETPMNENGAQGFVLPWTPSPKVVNGKDGSFSLPNGVSGKYFYAGTNKGGVGQSPGSPDWRNYYPHLPFLETVRELLRQKGYTLETDITDESWIPCANPLMGPSGYSYEQSCQSKNIHLVGPVTSADLEKNINLTWNQEVKEIDSGRLGGDGEFLFRALEDCNITFSEFCNAHKITPRTSVIQFGRNIVQYNSNGGSIQDFKGSYNSLDYVNGNADPISVENTFFASMKKGDYIAGRMQFIIFGTDAVMIENVGIKFNILASNFNDDSPNPFTLLGAPLDLLASTGFKNCKEFVQAFLQLYGLTVEIDGVNKTIRAYSAQEFYNRKNRALDWTGKLSIDTPEQTFTIGSYAQSNIIKFNDNSDDNVSDSTSFAVKNKALPLSKDLMTIGFEAGRNIYIDPYAPHPYPWPDGTSIANYPVFEVTAEENVAPENWQRELKGSEKPHIIRRASGLNTAISIPIEQGAISTSVIMPIAQHRIVGDYVAGFYGRMINDLLVNARAVKVKLNLNVLDIAQLDLFTPIMLNGIFFYISKINNFVKGELTSVDLIKM